MKKVVFFILLVVMMFMVSSCGDVSNAKENIDKSSLYSTDEVNKAVDVAKDYFWKNFDGCTLTSIEYDDNSVVSEQESLCKVHNVDFAIVLTLEYNEDKSEEFKDFILGSSDKKSWTVLEYGYL